MGTYLIVYGVARYFIEFFRGDPGRGEVPGLHDNDAGNSVCLVIGGGLLWMRRAPLRPPSWTSARMAAPRRRKGSEVSV